MRIRKLLLVVLLGLFLLTTGCGLQELSKVKPSGSSPSWSVDMRVPLVKGTLNIGKEIEDLLADQLPSEVVIEPDMDNDGIFTYKFNQTIDPVGMPTELLSLNEADFAITPVSWGGDPTAGPESGGVIQLNDMLFFNQTSYSVPYPTNADLADTMLGTPQTVTFNQGSTPATPLITIPGLVFDSITFTDAAVNDIAVSLSTDEPIDELTISLYQEGNPTALSTVSWTNITANIDGSGTSLLSTYLDTQYLSLGGQTLVGGSNLFFEITLTVHSTSANQIQIDMAPSTQFEVGEVIGGDATQYGFDVSQLANISIDSVKPFAQLPVDQLTFESGQIQISEEKISADGQFLFDVNLTMVDENNTELNWLQPDPNGGWYIDLAGKTITKGITISASVNPHIVNYDVWDNGTGQIVPYSYSLGVAMSNVSIQSLTLNASDLSTFMDDPNPDTPVWDISLGDQASNIERLPLDLPENLNMGIGSFNLDMTLDNQTDLQGTVTLLVQGFDSETATTPTATTSQLTLNLNKRSVFKLSEQPGYLTFLDELKDLLNSQPKFIEVVPGGTVEVTDQITITSGDSIGGEVNIGLPIQLTIFQGGVTVDDIYDDHMDLSTDSRDTLNQMAEYIEEAVLNVEYVNKSTLGLGGTFTFSAPGYQDQVIDFDVQPAHYNQATGKIKFTVDRALVELLANPAGFDLKADVRIPNITGEDHEVSLSIEDKLDFNLYMDGVMDVHLPSDM